jgi:hypothetical protein
VLCPVGEAEADGEGERLGAADDGAAGLAGAAGLVAVVACASVARWTVLGPGAGLSAVGPIGGEALELPAAAFATVPAGAPVAPG